MKNRIKSFVTFARRHPFQAVLICVLVGKAVAIGGTKPEPPPVVVEAGIRLTERTVDAKGLSVKWESDDSRIIPGETVFIVEARDREIRLGNKIIFRPKNTQWYEIGRTTDYELSRSGMWVDKTREIRVRTVIEGVAQ